MPIGVHVKSVRPDAKLAARTSTKQQKTLAHPHPEHAPGHQCRLDPAINRTCERFTLTSEGIIDNAPEKALDIAAGGALPLEHGSV